MILVDIEISTPSPLSQCSHSYSYIGMNRFSMWSLSSNIFVQSSRLNPQQNLLSRLAQLFEIHSPSGLYSSPEISF